MNNCNTLKQATFFTPLGEMIAIADEKFLYLLAFTDQHRLEKRVQQLQKETSSCIVSGTTAITDLIEKELNHYFSGNLQEFKTPLFLSGTPFQKKTWLKLQTVGYGETRSYSDIASSLQKSSAFRAVANANGANRLAIIIPCHRIINHDGKLGGYAGGLTRKEWLINHEQQR